MLWGTYVQLAVCSVGSQRPNSINAFLFDDHFDPVLF